MWRARGDKWKLKGLEIRDWRQDIESDAIKNLFGEKEDIKVSASVT